MVPSKVSGVKTCSYFGGFWYISGNGNVYFVQLSFLLFKSSLFCALARKDSQKLAVCIPVLV